MDSALKRLRAGGFSVGLELPLDNDWSSAARYAAASAEQGTAVRLPGEPDMHRHLQLAQLADRLGYRALWLRDVPLYDPSFGDAAQVFETFSYLGYLAAATQHILLGTAAVVLPLREPLLTLKSAATVDQLSGGRLLLGVASGDRPVEYPIFGRDFAGRGAAFRQQVDLARNWAEGSLPPGVQLIPRPAQPALPLLVAGLAQQSPQWIGQNMDGCLAYPGTPDDHAARSAAWRAVAGEDKPYISFIHLDLAANPDEPFRRHRFGGRAGRKALASELQAMQQAGVTHIGLHLRRNERPLEETMQEIAEYVLPEFHRAALPRAA